MKLDSIINQYHFQCLIKNHSNKFNDFEQKFLISMLSSLTYERDITPRQFDYCRGLIERLKTYERIL